MAYHYHQAVFEISGYNHMASIQEERKSGLVNEKKIVYRTVIIGIK